MSLGFLDVPVGPAVTMMCFHGRGRCAQLCRAIVAEIGAS